MARRFPAELAVTTVLLLVAAAVIATLLLRSTGPGAARDAVAPIPGLTLATRSSAPPRLVVTSVRSNSDAASQGIAAGDDILTVDGHAVNSAEEAGRQIAADRPRAIELTLQHDGQTRRVSLRPEERVYGAQGPSR